MPVMQHAQQTEHSVLRYSEALLLRQLEEHMQIHGPMIPHLAKSAYVLRDATLVPFIWIGCCIPTMFEHAHPNAQLMQAAYQDITYGPQ